MEPTSADEPRYSWRRRWLLIVVPVVVVIAGLVVLSTEVVDIE